MMIFVACSCFLFFFSLKGGALDVIHLQCIRAHAVKWPNSILRRIYDQEIVWSLLSKYRWPKTSNSLQCLYTWHCQRQTWTCFKLLFLFCSTTFGYCIDLFEKKSLFQRIGWLVVCTLTRLRIACLPLFFFSSCFWSPPPQPALRSLFFLLFFVCRPISVKTARRSLRFIVDVCYVQVSFSRVGVRMCVSFCWFLLFNLVYIPEKKLPVDVIGTLIIILRLSVVFLCSWFDIWTHPR